MLEKLTNPIVLASLILGISMVIASLLFPSKTGYELCIDTYVESEVNRIYGKDAKQYVGEDHYENLVRFKREVGKGKCRGS